MDEVRGDRLESLFRLMLATGLRRGEALALHWRDVDLDAGTLRVRWNFTHTSRGLQLGEPKTDRSRRTVPLPRSAVETLQVHRFRQEEWCSAEGSRRDREPVIRPRPRTRGRGLTSHLHFASVAA
ncbi:site-specific integrase [Geodermatophilus sp. SYSU D00766]